MGRESYRYQSLDKMREERKRMNPMWRGIGCLLISFFGAMGYLFAQWFLRANYTKNWVYLPAEAYNPDLPNWLNFLEPFFDNGALIKLVVALLFIVISFGIVSFFYAIGFPIRPGEQDAPPADKRLARRQRREAEKAARERQRFKY